MFLYFVVIVVLIIIFFYILYTEFGIDLGKVALEMKLPSGGIKDPCIFLENDIATDNVHDSFGQQLRTNKKIECDRCSEYVYKGLDGCSPYFKDPYYSVKDRKTNSPVGICTAIGFPKTCKFKSKNPPQTE